MSDWISNGESGASVRAKLNALYASVSALASGGGTVAPSISVGVDVTHNEGASGSSTTYDYTIAYSAGTTVTDRVMTVTSAGYGSNPANAADFVGGVMPSGNHTFSGATSSWTFTATVQGDNAVEPTEQFQLTFALAGGNTVTALGTITNDDSAAPTLPTGYTSRFSAADITPQTDNTALASWPDSVTPSYTATQSTSGKRPKYRTSGLNGKPCVQFDGTQVLIAPKASSAITTAIASGECSVIVVANVKGFISQFGTLFGGVSASNNNSVLLLATGAKVGVYDGGSTINRFTFTTGFGSFGLTATKNRGFQGSSVTVSRRSYVSGTSYYQENNGVEVTNGAWGIGGWGSDEWYSNADIYEVLVYPFELTPAQMIQLDDWARYTFGQTNPRSAATSFRAFMGNSLTGGTNASDADHFFPSVTASTNSWPVGTWTNLGVTGADSDGENANIGTDMNGLATATGNKLTVTYNEWINTAINNGPSACQGKTNTNLTKIKTMGATALGFWSTTSFASSTFPTPYAARPTYNSYYDTTSNRTALSIDFYAPVHTNTNIGVNGAAGTNGNTYFAGDGVHLTDAGYAVLGGLLATALASA